MKITKELQMSTTVPAKKGQGKPMNIRLLVGLGIGLMALAYLAEAQCPPDLMLSRWGGQPTTIPSDGFQMTPTPNGNLILGFFNVDASPNDGQVTITSGGSFFKQFPIPALEGAPVLYVHNFQGNNLNVSNTSTGGGRPPLGEAWAPGISASGSLPNNGIQVPLPIYTSRKAISLPQRMLLTLAAGNGQYTVFGVYIGGEVSLYCVNAPDSTKVPDGYTKVTSDNSLQLPVSANGAAIYVVNLSTRSQTGATVTLQAL